jgi:hypothetical protein
MHSGILLAAKNKFLYVASSNFSPHTSTCNPKSYHILKYILLLQIYF